ncbi:MAG TPA: ABC transporter permease [Terriglobales bacterium]|nr:ABC transporter permease [Terriglobales bacterium]
MHLKESIFVALDTLWSHKLRSFLTLLGIIVSIWTLVAVVSLVQGVNGYVGDKIAHLGSNAISVSQFSLEEMTDQKLFREAQKRNKPITLSEYDYLRDHSRLAKNVVASSSRGTGTNLKAGNHNMTDVRVEGDTANAIALAVYDVAAGRFLSPSDVSRGNNVAFIGPDVANQLFPSLDPIGQTLNIDGHDYQVIGEATVQGNVFGQSQDSFVIIPIGVYRDIYGTKDSVDVDVQASSALALPALSDEVRMLMRSVRHLHYSDPDTFGLIGADSLMALFHQLTGVIAAVMIGVAFVFLVVGGIVIMNIMLAAVTERTREVGIRKALGAKRKDILSQFLVEAAVLSTVGGLLGVALAWAFTLLAGQITPLPFSLPWGAVLTALGISTAVGLFFGIYPAQKAAKLEPITALRSET